MKPRVALAMCTVRDCSKEMAAYSSKYCSMHKTRFWRHRQANNIPIEFKEKSCKGCSGLFVDTDKNQRAVFCVDCRKVRWKFYKRTREWEKSEAGKKYMKAYGVEHRLKYKKIVFDHYGWSCRCCGEKVEEFLSVDHVNNDGRKDRKKYISGARMYKKIIAEGFPNSYQILCMNCNFGKKITGGTCPHLNHV